MATLQNEVRDCRQFIGGEWVDAGDGKTFDDVTVQSGGQPFPF